MECWKYLTVLTPDARPCCRPTQRWQCSWGHHRPNGSWSRVLTAVGKLSTSLLAGVKVGCVQLSDPIWQVTSCWSETGITRTSYIPLPLPLLKHQRLSPLTVTSWKPSKEHRSTLWYIVWMRPCGRLQAVDYTWCHVKTVVLIWLTDMTINLLRPCITFVGHPVYWC